MSSCFITRFFSSSFWFFEFLLRVSSSLVLSVVTLLGRKMREKKNNFREDVFIFCRVHSTKAFRKAYECHLSLIFSCVKSYSSIPCTVSQQNPFVFFPFSAIHFLLSSLWNDDIVISGKCRRIEVL